MFELENGKPKLVLTRYGKNKFINYVQVCTQLFKQYFILCAFSSSLNRWLKGLYEDGILPSKYVVQFS